MEAHDVDNDNDDSRMMMMIEEEVLQQRMMEEEEDNEDDDDAAVDDDGESIMSSENEDGDNEDDDDDDDSIASASYFSSDDDDDDFENDDELTTTTTTLGGGGVIHYGVSCDECGISPIRGIRYHSRRIIDYDICVDCYERNHLHWTMDDAFLTLRQNTNIDETTIFGNGNNGNGNNSNSNNNNNDPNNSFLRIDALGWINLVETLCLHGNQLQNLDLNLDAYEEYPNNNNYHFSHENYYKVSNIIANSKTLKCLYIEFPRGEGTAYHNHVFNSIFDGIKKNQSIITLSITLDFGGYYNDNDNETSSFINDTICDLIRTHKYIRHLLLRHRKKRLQGMGARRGEFEELMRIINEAVVNDRNNSSSRSSNNNPDDDDESRLDVVAMLARIQRNNMEQHNDHVRLATKSLFDALSETSLYSFACKVGPDLQLSNECRIAAANALKTRPYLKTVKGDFVDLDHHHEGNNNNNTNENNENNNTDGENNNNGNNGINNNNDDNNEEEEDIPDLDRLMKEKQNYWTKNWNDLDTTYTRILQILDDIRIRIDDRDQVAALFHLIRNNPGSLPKQH